MYWIEEIAKERTAGAHEVAMRCAAHLTGLCRTFPGGRDANLLNRLTEVGLQLVKAQPTLAPVLNLVNGLLLHLQQGALAGADAEVMRSEAIRFIEVFRKTSKNSLDRIATRALGLLEHVRTVLTLSGSETVAQVLETAHRAAILREVVVAESRPLMEGKLMARRLGASGLRVTLIVDAAVGLLARSCDVLVVGADAVRSDSFVNKIGTWSALRAAKEAGRSRYALAEENKLVPPDWSFPASEGDPREVLAEGWTNVTARNPYFEQIPLGELTGLITENGVYSGSSLARKVAGLRLCPLLLPAFRGGSTMMTARAVTRGEASVSRHRSLGERGAVAIRE